MFKDPLQWFPNPAFSTLFAWLVIGVGLIDYIIPWFVRRGRTGDIRVIRDRGSFMLIQLLSLLALALGVWLRYLNWGIAPPATQYLGLVFIVAGIVLREWAIIKLGRLFSRVVEIETDHHLVTDGPFRWFRHPAYTGMVFVYVGFALALGTWPGTLVASILLMGATLYRIRVEEKVLLEAFGDEYRIYMHRTWKLFPGL